MSCQKILTFQKKKKKMWMSLYRDIMEVFWRHQQSAFMNCDNIDIEVFGQKCSDLILSPSLSLY